MRASLLIMLTSLLVFACGTGKEQDSRNEMEDLGIIPMLKLDRDTIALGDSLTGVVGGIFKSSLGKEEKQQLINSLAFRIDTVDIELKFDTQFFTTPRVNDSTYRFGFLPKYHNSVGTRRSIYAAIRVEYYSKDNQKQEHIFRNRFDYYIKK